MPPVNQLVEQAVASIGDLIRSDREQAPAEVRPLLEHLETHLLEPDLDAERLRQACGVRDPMAARRFHAATSRSPDDYIEHRRLEVACELLARTDLQLSKIAQEIGYSTAQAFLLAFSRWAGMRASVYRRICRQKLVPLEALQERIPTAETIEANFQKDPWLQEVLPRALVGDLSSDEAGQFVERLFLRSPDGD